MTCPGAISREGQRFARPGPPEIVGSARGTVGCVQAALCRAGAVALTLAAPIAALIAPSESAAQAVGQAAVPVKDRHIDVSRAGATQAAAQRGRSGDRRWLAALPHRAGSAAFNDAMATLKATDGAAPAAVRIQGVREGLECNLSLPALTADGWIPPGRIWVSPTQYVLIVHSPRLRDGQSYRRRPSGNMRYFVYHEFHNSTRNTDPFDTISSHSGSVFVSFYMSKQWTDAKGRRFVIVVQVAPHDVVSFHATDKGSAGPGMEVAKNYTDRARAAAGPRRHPGRHHRQDRDAAARGREPRRHRRPADAHAVRAQVAGAAGASERTEWLLCRLCPLRHSAWRQQLASSRT